MEQEHHQNPHRCTAAQGGTSSGALSGIGIGGVLVQLDPNEHVMKYWKPTQSNQGTHGTTPESASGSRAQTPFGRRELEQERPMTGSMKTVKRGDVDAFVYVSPLAVGPRRSGRQI